MKKRFANFSSTAVLALYSLIPAAGMLVAPQSVSAFTGDGAGTLLNPFIVNDCDDLQSINDDAIAGQTGDKYYILDGNINCTATATANSGLGFDPIDDFEGIFDGQGYTIDGLTINRPSEDYVGLFGNTSNDSIVANFSMTSVNVTGRNYVGSVAGFSHGNVLGVRVSGAVSGASTGSAAGTGGIAGRHQESSGGVALSQLGFSGTVSNTGVETGGIVGTLANTTLDNSFVDATITGTNYVGGLAGVVGSCCNSVTNSYAVGAVIGTSRVGGAIGSVSNMNETIVDNIFAAAAVTGVSNSGAVIGIIEDPYGPEVSITDLYFDETAATLSDCYASTDVAVTCTARNSDGVDSEHFYNATNAPLSSWDFTNVWSQQVGDYPSLQPQDELTNPGAVTDIAVTFPSAPVDAEVAFTAPVSSGSFPINEYQVEVKLADATWDDVIASENDSTSPITISSLSLGTDYTFRVRALSVYGAGAWTEYAYATPDQEIVPVSTCTALEAVDETPSNMYAAIRLTQDIDCGETDNFDLLYWDDGDFQGVLDGQGFTIQNLTITQSDNWDIGLFVETENATIQDVSFTSASLTGTENSENCGIVAGRMYDTNVLNVSLNDISVTCNGRTGGLAGTYESGYSNAASVENVTVNGDVRSESFEVDYGWGPELTGGNDTGGLFGRVLAEYEGSVRIARSFSEASIISDGYNAGGIAGRVSAEIEDDSEIPTTLIVQDSYTDGDVWANVNAGGILGNMESYNDGYEATVEVEVENAYSSATVSAAGSAGGIVGYMDEPSDEGEQYILNNVFAAGAVSADSHDYALIGSSDGLGDGELVINNSYFDRTTTGQTGATAYDDTIGGWTAVNTDGSNSNYFINNSSNPPLNEWDFENTWETRLTDYPVLLWNPADDDLNGDNIPDGEQPSIGGYVSSLTNKVVAIDVGEQCELTTDDMTTEANLDVQDAAYEYDNGLWDFEADCGTPGHTTTIMLYYYSVDRSSLVLRKHNPNTGSFSTIDDAVYTSQTIAGQNVTVVTYQVTDGGERDTDGLVDGMITDPAGLARAITGAPNTGIRIK